MKQKQHFVNSFASELMFDAALPTGGFMPRAKKVRAYGGIEWTRTAHDLDRVFERDGIAYGTEIKNTRALLKLRPLFIVRMPPKSYIEMVRRAGGLRSSSSTNSTPMVMLRWLKTVRQQLGLPVDSPAAIQDGTVQRFLNWHLKQLPKVTEP